MKEGAMQALLGCPIGGKPGGLVLLEAKVPSERSANQPDDSVPSSRRMPGL
jgi:hypothetical protein